ncbi:MAG: MBL fold metallo-hydrolase [Desulfosudaceae bacterium]
MTAQGKATTAGAALDVTILGSGTCVPSLTRSACAVLVETGAARVVLDCGPGTMRQLLAAGVRVCEVTHLFFSHFHPDHTGEMAAFLFANRYGFSPGRERPLFMAGGKGQAAFYAACRSVYGQWIELADSLLEIGEFSSSQADQRDFPDFTVITRPVTHRPESIAFRLESGGRAVVYSGDTDYDENLARLAAGADLFICESAHPDGCKQDGHLTPGLAGKIAAAAEVKQLVLTHLYPACDQVDIRQQAAAAFAGPVTVAEDLMRFSL